MKIEIKIVDQRLKEWGLPKFGTAGAAAVDLIACALYQKKADGKPNMEARSPLEAAITIEPGDLQYVGVGFAMHIGNPGYAALVLPRSGLGSAQGVVLGNGIGLVDSDYQRELIVPCLNRSANGTEPFKLLPGDRMAQMMIVPVVQPEWQVVDTFSETSSRGLNGFGSTGYRG